MRVAYTRLRAVDQMRQLPCCARPARLCLCFRDVYGHNHLEIEGACHIRRQRIDIQNDFPFSRVKMAPYGKVDMRAAYKVNDRLSIFARAENITNARYQEIRDYGTAGPFLLCRDDRDMVTGPPTLRRLPPTFSLLRTCGASRACAGRSCCRHCRCVPDGRRQRIEPHKIMAGVHRK